jgi:hypothetical protein
LRIQPVDARRVAFREGERKGKRGEAVLKNPLVQFVIGLLASGWLALTGIQ